MRKSFYLSGYINGVAFAKEMLADNVEAVRVLDEILVAMQKLDN